MRVGVHRVEGICMAGKIYIVEDHAIVREMLGMTVERMMGLSVCGTAASAEEALEQFEKAGADLVLVDMSLPGMSGSELIRAVSERWPGLRCLVLSAHAEAWYVEGALQAGARGYVLKGDPSELERAIRRVLGGEMYLSTSLGAA